MITVLLNPKSKFQIFNISIQNPKSKIYVCLLLITFLPSLALANDKLTIYTVNYPLKYFAGRIGAEHVKVVFPAPPDIDPAYWMPDRKTIADYQKANLILLNGAHYAKWTEKVTLPRSKMIDTSKKVKDKYIKTSEAVTHSHGPKGEHAHEDVAFTLWLDLDLAAKQAREIEKAFTHKRPELRDIFQKNYTALEKDLMALDRKIKGILSNNQDHPLIASHPVYDYLSHRYGLNMKSLHWEPDKVPGNSQWMQLKKILKEHPARWMIWEGKPSKESVEKLKSMGVRSIVFDPCGNVPDKGDFLEVMKKNVENLGMAFK
jgi:zinc transport system substrate-binding protein